MTARLQAFMAAEGLPYNPELEMIYNSRPAQELAKWADDRPQREELHMALYQAFFVAGRDIGDIEVLVELAQTIGLPPGEARQVLEQRQMRAAVDADWRHARSLGVTAVPTFAVGTVGVVGAQPYQQLAALMEHVGATRRTAPAPDG